MNGNSVSENRQEETKKRVGRDSNENKENRNLKKDREEVRAKDEGGQ